MIKGIIIGAVIMYLLGAVEGLDEYLYLPLEWIIDGLGIIKDWFVTFRYFKTFPLLMKHGINPFWTKFKVVNERLTKEEKIKFVNCLTREDEKQRMIEYFGL